MVVVCLSSPAGASWASRKMGGKFGRCRSQRAPQKCEGGVP